MNAFYRDRKGVRYWVCCEQMLSALHEATDGEGYRPLAWVDATDPDRIGLFFGRHQAPIAQCPWCLSKCPLERAGEEGEVELLRRQFLREYPKE